MYSSILGRQLHADQSKRRLGLGIGRSVSRDRYPGNGPTSPKEVHRGNNECDVVHSVDGDWSVWLGCMLNNLTLFRIASGEERVALETNHSSDLINALRIARCLMTSSNSRNVIEERGTAKELVTCSLKYLVDSEKHCFAITRISPFFCPPTVRKLITAVLEAGCGLVYWLPR